MDGCCKTFVKGEDPSYSWEKKVGNQPPSTYPPTHPTNRVHETSDQIKKIVVSLRVRLD
jgi:hypothetical protein